jgi:hypothetical protein
VAHLGVAPQALHPVEGVLDAGAYPGAQAVDAALDGGEIVRARGRGGSGQRTAGKFVDSQISSFRILCNFCRESLTFNPQDSWRRPRGAAGRGKAEP